MPPSMIGPVAGEGVDVEAHAGARTQAAREPLLGAARNPPAVVSFSSAGSPSTAATFMPAARTTVVSSVGARAGPAS